MVTYEEVHNDGSETDEEFLNYLGSYEYDDTSENSVVNAYVGDRIIGSIKWNSLGWIEHIYVRPEFRDRGVMRELVGFYPFRADRIDPDCFVVPGLYEKIYSIVDAL